MPVRTHHQPRTRSAHLHVPWPSEDLPARQSHSARRLLQWKTRIVTRILPRYAMNVTVQQAPSSLPSKYEIETPGAIYSAEKTLISLHNKIELFAPHGRSLATLRGHFSFRSKYDFELSDGKVYHFCCEKLWKRVFTCESAGES